MRAAILEEIGRLTIKDVPKPTPGYEEALVYNGAIRLAPEYGKSAPGEIVIIAKESKANIILCITFKTVEKDSLPI